MLGHGSARVRINVKILGGSIFGLAQWAGTALMPLPPTLPAPLNSLSWRSKRIEMLCAYSAMLKPAGAACLAAAAACFKAIARASLIAAPLGLLPSIASRRSLGTSPGLTSSCGRASATKRHTGMLSLGAFAKVIFKYHRALAESLFPRVFVVTPIPANRVSSNSAARLTGSMSYWSLFCVPLVRRTRFRQWADRGKPGSRLLPNPVMDGLQVLPLSPRTNALV